MNMLKSIYYSMGVSMTLGLIGISSDAFAQTGAAAGNTASTISDNITSSLSRVPDLISALSYLGGITIGTLGILKIKDHVENPSNTPLKEGAIRLATGGALLTLPFIFDVMNNTIGTGGTTPGPAALPGL